MPVIYIFLKYFIVKTNTIIEKKIDKATYYLFPLDDIISALLQIEYTIYHNQIVFDIDI